MVGECRTSIDKHSYSILISIFQGAHVHRLGNVAGFVSSSFYRQHPDKEPINTCAVSHTHRDIPLFCVGGTGTKTCRSLTWPPGFRR